MPDYSPVFSTGAMPMTVTVGATPVTAGQFLEVSGNGVVGPTNAITDGVIGVAGYDAPAGARLTMWPVNAVHELICSAAVGAGQQVEPSGQKVRVVGRG